MCRSGRAARISARARAAAPGRDDTALDAVLHVAGKTIGSTGLAASDARMIYDENDRGTSCVFDLTDDQRDEVLEALRDKWMREQLLISWRR
jgi:hypothetical protein